MQEVIQKHTTTKHKLELIAPHADLREISFGYIFRDENSEERHSCKCTYIDGFNTGSYIKDVYTYETFPIPGIYDGHKSNYDHFTKVDECHIEGSKLTVQYNYYGTTYRIEADVKTCKGVLTKTEHYIE